MNKIFLATQLLRNMGLRYAAFRAWYEFKRRTGLLGLSFPVRSRHRYFLSLDQWREKRRPFFFANRSDVGSFDLDNESRKALKLSAENILSGNIPFFGAEWVDLGKSYDWVTNPITGFRFDPHQHWTKVEDLRREQGDIKYVWEKNRFCYLYTVMRYDHHFDLSHSDFVFDEILSWIEANPTNCGPNWKCSQEISLRVLVWIFALYFYADSEFLAGKVVVRGVSADVFEHILNSIWQQTQHIWSNRRFSQIAVRNNHIITEALALHTVGLLLPWFPSAQKWERVGHRLLEKEAAHQFLDDGTYLQYSTNYQRAVCQLYTWALALWKKNELQVEPQLRARLEKNLYFLRSMQDTHSGMLPNYGPNDGSLFFPLSSCDFRDYRPQLDALATALNAASLYGEGTWAEERCWYGLGDAARLIQQPQPATIAHKTGGFFVLRSIDRFAFVRCGDHRARPSHADNLHLDLWYKGKNVLRDAGSYSYNTDDDTLRFFVGTRSHNTVMLGKHDQMLKGPRFIWTHWSSAEDSAIEQQEDRLVFTGTVHVYRHVSNRITHTRTVVHYLAKPRWEITDVISGWSGEVTQIWNPSPDFGELGLSLCAHLADGTPLAAQQCMGQYSRTYGVSEAITQLLFTTDQQHIHTVIEAVS